MAKDDLADEIERLEIDGIDSEQAMHYLQHHLQASPRLSAMLAIVERRLLHPRMAAIVLRLDPDGVTFVPETPELGSDGEHDMWPIVEALDEALRAIEAHATKHEHETQRHN